MSKPHLYMKRNGLMNVCPILVTISLHMLTMVVAWMDVTMKTVIAMAPM